MQTQVTARHVDISPRLRDYAEERASKLTRYFDNIISAHIILSQNNTPAEDKTAEINLDVSQKRLSAENAASTHEDAIDACVDNLRRQLQKHKAQLRSHDKDFHR